MSSKEALMKAQHQEYGFRRTVDKDFGTAVESAREALKQEGFGILCEIRVDEKLKERIGVDFRRYVILGACIQPLAYETLQEDLDIGLLLPCNAVAYESEEPNRSICAAVDAKAMLSVVGENLVLNEVPTEVNQRLQRAVEQI